MQSLVRINKNRSVYEPSHQDILKGYKRKHRKLPTLGDDVTDGESDNGDDEASASGSGADSD